jgi:hypothetical protein
MYFIRATLSASSVASNNGVKDYLAYGFVKDILVDIVITAETMVRQETSDNEVKSRMHMKHEGTLREKGL